MNELIFDLSSGWSLLFLVSLFALGHNDWTQWVMICVWFYAEDPWRKLLFTPTGLQKSEWHFLMEIHILNVSQVFEQNCQKASEMLKRLCVSIVQANYEEKISQKWTYNVIPNDLKLNVFKMYHYNYHFDMFHLNENSVRSMSLQLNHSNYSNWSDKFHNSFPFPQTEKWIIESLITTNLTIHMTSIHSDYECLTIRWF